MSLHYQDASFDVLYEPLILKCLILASLKDNEFSITLKESIKNNFHFYQYVDIQCLQKILFIECGKTINTNVMNIKR